MRLVEPDDVFHYLECEQQFLSHDSWIDVVGPARRVAIPFAKQLLAAYCSGPEGGGLPDFLDRFGRFNSLLLQIDALFMRNHGRRPTTASKTKKERL